MGFAVEYRQVEGEHARDKDVKNNPKE